MKILILLCFVTLSLAHAPAQTAAQLEDKYPHHEVYEVQPGIMMTPTFNAQGTVCAMRLEKAHLVGAGVDFNELDEHAAYALIDKLVPVGERGLKLDSEKECMSLCRTVHKYANVTITLDEFDGVRAITVQWHNRSCDQS